MSTAQKTTRTRKPKPLAVMEPVHCHICGEMGAKDESIEFDGKFLCSDCCDVETVICDKCGVRVWNDDNAGDYDTRLCQSCYDSHYTRCGDCGGIIRNDRVYHIETHGDEPYCYYCHSNPQETNAIRNYSYKPTPIFYGIDGSNRYFGVELEVDYGGRDSKSLFNIRITSFLKPAQEDR